MGSTESQRRKFQGYKAITTHQWQALCHIVRKYGKQDQRRTFCRTYSHRLCKFSWITTTPSLLPFVEGHWSTLSMTSKEQLTLKPRTLLLNEHLGGHVPPSTSIHDSGQPVKYFLCFTQLPNGHITSCGMSSNEVRCKDFIWKYLQRGTDTWHDSWKQ